MLLGYKDSYRRLFGFDCFANGTWKKVSLQHNRAFETFSLLRLVGTGWACERQSRPVYV